MYEVSFNKIKNINIEMFEIIPNVEEKLHLRSSCMNLLLSKNYLEGYYTFKKYSQYLQNYNNEKLLSIIIFISTELIKMKEYDRAKEILIDGIENNLVSLAIYNNLAITFFKLNDIQSCKSMLNKALELDPYNIKVKNNIDRIDKYLERSKR